MPVCKQGSGTLILGLDTSFYAWLGSYVSPTLSGFIFTFLDIYSQFSLLWYLRHELGVSGHFRRHGGFYKGNIS